MMRIFKIILPVLILALGFGAYQLLASMREPPQRVARSYTGSARRSHRRPVATGTGRG